MSAVLDTAHLTALLATSTTTAPIAAASITLFFLSISYLPSHRNRTAQVKYAMPLDLSQTAPEWGSCMYSSPPA